ncbi:MAG: bifunctional folylpolyglutamate synthase/dihydrofolate synthase, partial [Eubacteriaceae bacterium]|nr:bifunctional folylpolyglutamate synthase/dihydrofolate synthase [Eubacteriaceae bacterium]
MNYAQTIAYIESRGLFGMKLGLDTIRILLATLGQPQQNLKFIHVAGTNGKGSISHMTSDILSAAGYRTGLYTSPALETFNERICLDGVPISNDTLVRVTARVKNAAETMVAAGHPEPTAFEIETALAICTFADARVDYAIMEVGMGGRLDATNVIPAPEIAVISRIGLDHTAYLGNTLAKIAGEKAAIIKPGSTVVMAPQEPEAAAVITATAQSKNCPLMAANSQDLVPVSQTLKNQTFRYTGDNLPGLSRFDLHLLGQYQQENCITALTVVQVLRAQGAAISNAAVTSALSRITFPGRFEILDTSPLVLIDGAHNVDGIKSFALNLKTYFPHHKLHLYFGMLSDKDIDHALDLLIPMADTIGTLTPDSDRALGASQMVTRIYKRCHRKATAYATIDQALDTLCPDPRVLNAFVGSL